MADALNTSELGSKLYWDEAYAREIRNHAEDAQDEGTIWFDDTGAEDKVIQLLENLADEDILHKSGGGDTPASRFLDLGTGNGHMLFALLEEEWEGELVGVDYSETSVDLSRQITKQKQADGTMDEHVPVFTRWDLLHDAPGKWLDHGFDVVLDKGTFDAISLSAEADAQGRRVHEKYRSCILPLLKQGGLFIITSCNWTREEIVNWFAEAGPGLYLMREVKYPSFTFGGQQGSSVCTLVFKKS